MSHFPFTLPLRTDCKMLQCTEFKHVSLDLHSLFKKYVRLKIQGKFVIMISHIQGATNHFLALYGGILTI